MGSPMTNEAGEEQDEPKAIGPGLWSALKAAASDWSAHKSAKAGAAIAYYSIFSLGPLIVVVISIAALIFGREGVQREVTEAIRGQRLGSWRIGDPPNHLRGRLVLPLTLIRDLPQQVVFSPRRIGNLHDQLGPHPVHAGELQGRAKRLSRGGGSASGMLG